MNIADKKLSKKALEKKIDDAQKIVIPGGIYTHYKNPAIQYVVLALSLDVNTLEPVVMYGEPLGAEIVWARPLSQWIEKVEVDGKVVDRFTLIGEMSEEKECDEDCDGENC